MQELHGDFDGALRVTDALALRGTVHGPITVAAGGRFVLHGICTGALVVEAGGDAEIWGLVKGSVRNLGGALSLHVLVEGDVETTAGVTWISPTSVVRGMVRSPGDHASGARGAV